MLLLRHGKTKYLGVFPDLTREGQAHVESVATGPVSDWMAQHEIAHRNLAIVTSPSPRAHGTAWTLCKAIGHPRRLQFSDALAPMKWRDEARAQAVLQQFRGKSYVDYETEPVFQDSEIFETPDEVRARWYGAFGKTIVHRWNDYGHFRAASTPGNAILVSHYEVFSPMVRDLFGIIASEDTALCHAEPIALSISSDSTDHDVAHVTGEFRGIHLVKKFSLSTNRFDGCP